MLLGAQSLTNAVNNICLPVPAPPIIYPTTIKTIRCLSAMPVATTELNWQLLNLGLDQKDIGKPYYMNQMK